MKKKFFKNNDDNQVNMLNCGTRHLYSKRKNTIFLFHVPFFYSFCHSNSFFCFVFQNLDLYRIMQN